MKKNRIAVGGVQKVRKTCSESPNPNKLNRYFAALLICSFVLFCACATAKAASNAGFQYEFSKNTSQGFNYPNTSFAVFSDNHLIHPSLGITLPSFVQHINTGMELSLDSVELIDYAIKSIIESGVRFVLICGDVTNNGELIAHQLMAEKLKAFTNAGIAVYVVPGNHDINNPHAAGIVDGKIMPAPSISAEEFERIYGDYGFNAAIMRDTGSLSYVAEPAEGLWLLALDANRYRENTPENGGFSGGKISQKTAEWIATVLQAAHANNKAVMAMIHHGVVEHWKGQSSFHGSYLIDDYKNFGRFLASWNVKLAFSGHYHSQDIARADFGAKYIYDMETGSLLTPDCPVRFVEIKDNTVYIRSETIIDKLRPGTDFADNARVFMKKTVMAEVTRILARYKITGRDAEYLAEAAADAFCAHNAGDENPALRPPFNSSRLGFVSRIAYVKLKPIIDGLWKDIPPADNNVQLKL